jgi:hypothetical protein
MVTGKREFAAAILVLVGIKKINWTIARSGI